MARRRKIKLPAVKDLPSGEEIWHAVRYLVRLADLYEYDLSKFIVNGKVVDEQALEILVRLDQVVMKHIKKRASLLSSNVVVSIAEKVQQIFRTTADPNQRRIPIYRLFIDSEQLVRSGKLRIPEVEKLVHAKVDRLKGYMEAAFDAVGKMGGKSRTPLTDVRRQLKKRGGEHSEWKKFYSYFRSDNEVRTTIRTKLLR